jgi:tetratricopeptide (TPR) repeat protein
VFLRKSAKQRAVALDVNNGLIITGVVLGDVNFYQGMPLQRLNISWSNTQVLDNVDALLNWRSALTDLVGQETELKKLHAWATSTHPRRVLTITGEGGVGKTRLAFHFAEQLREQGWEAGELSDPDKPAAFHSGERGTLLVMDYPEGKGEVIDSLLKALKRMEEPKSPLRILFLSRSARFAQAVADRIGYLVDAPMTLGPLPNQDEYGWQLFEAAWQQMRTIKHLPKLTPPITQEAFFDWQAVHRLHSLPLFILAYALNLIEEPGATRLEGPEVIRLLVTRERGRMEGEAKAHGLDPQGLVVLKALAGVTGGLTADQVNTLSQTPAFDGKLPGYDTLRALSVWGSGELQEGQGRGLPALQPDILAADLLAQVLEREDDKPGEWQYAVLAIADERSVATARLGRLMHDASVTLGRVWPVEPLVGAVAGDPARCRQLSGALNRAYLERPLLPLAIAVSATLVEDVEDQAEQAGHLNNLSLRLAENGDRAGGLAAIQRAVEIHEQLAEANAAAYGPDLAVSLAGLADYQQKAGQTEVAKATLERAIGFVEPFATESTTYAELLDFIQRQLRKYRQVHRPKFFAWWGRN